MPFSHFKSSGQSCGPRKEIHIIYKNYSRLRDAVTDFFFFLNTVSAVNKVISDPEMRQVLIETLLFENANMEFTKIGPLKVREGLWKSGSGRPPGSILAHIMPP